MRMHINRTNRSRNRHRNECSAELFRAGHQLAPVSGFEFRLSCGRIVAVTIQAKTMSRFGMRWLKWRNGIGSEYAQFVSSSKSYIMRLPKKR